MKNRLKRWLYRYFVIVFVGCMLYLPMMTRKLANPDTMCVGLHYKYGHAYEKELGRWGLGFFLKLKGYTVNYTLVTFFCILMLGIITVLICDMFELESIPGIFVVSVSVFMSISAASVMTYYYCSDAYTFAYLLNVAAIWLLCKRRGIWPVCLSVFLIAASDALYQCYISVSISLCIIYLLKMILIKKDNLKFIAKTAVRFLLAGGIGSVLYVIITRSSILQSRLDYTLTGNRGFSELGAVKLKGIGGVILDCYRETFGYYFTNLSINNDFLGRKYINLFFLGLLVLAIGMLLFKQREKSRVFVLRVIMAAFLLLMFPLGLFIMLLVAPEVGVHATTWLLMLPAMNLFYVMAYVCADACVFQNCSAVKLKRIVIFALYGALTWVLAVYLSVFLDCMENNVEKTVKYASEIVSKLDALGIDEGYRILVMWGGVDLGLEENYEIVKGTVAEYGCLWESPDYLSCWGGVFREYLAKDYWMASIWELYEYSESELYKNMTVFPKEGSIVVQDDLVIIKINGN